MTSPARVRDLRLDTDWMSIRRHLSDVLDDIRKILGGGISIGRHLDGVLHTFQWTSAEAPVYLAPRGIVRPPLGLYVVSAKWSIGDQGWRASGLPVEWQWVTGKGEIRIDDVLETMAGTYYDVTVLILRS